MEEEPLTDEEAFRIRTHIIDTLIAKYSTLSEQRDKIDKEIETTPFPFQTQASDIESPRWKRLTRKL
jgi:hypothetical protein